MLPNDTAESFLSLSSSKNSRRVISSPSTATSDAESFLPTKSESAGELEEWTLVGDDGRYFEATQSGILISTYRSLGAARGWVTLDGRGKSEMLGS
jgi:hypothetical protein